MPNDGAGLQKAGQASPPQPKPQIHVFAITEEALLKSAKRLEGVSPVEGRRPTRRKDFARRQRRGLSGLANAPSPGKAYNRHAIACPVQHVRIRVIKLKGCNRSTSISVSCTNQVFKPRGVRKSIGIQEDNILGSG